MTPPAGPTTLLCQTRSTPLALVPHRQVIVEFRAPWCGPCRGIDSFIGQLSAKYSDVLFVTVDVEDVEAEVDELERRGIALEKYDVPGADARGIVTAGGAKAAWFKDSEGNIMAVIQNLEKPSS